MFLMHYFASIVICFFAVAVLRPAASTARGANDSIKAGQGFGIEVNTIVGKVVKHEAKFTLPIPTLTTGLNISFVQHTYGKKAWEQRTGYPSLGVGVTYLNYGIDS